MTIPVQHFDANLIGRDFVVGDLHGCRAMLFAAMEQLEFDKTKDRMFSVGDLVDRGPESADTLRLANEPWFHAVRGNHEQMMLDQDMYPNSKEHWYINGGKWWDSITTEDERTELKQIAEYMPLVITVGEGKNRFNVLHAEFYGTDSMLDDFTNPTSHQAVQMIWGRTLINTPKENPFLSKTFVGHTPIDSPTTHSGHVFIDTGAVYDKNLCVIEVSTMQALLVGAT